MKPKTAFQKRVVAINGSLPDFNEKYFTTIYNRQCEHIAFRGKGGKYVCGDCGKEITLTPNRKGECHCPECGHKMKLMTSRKWSCRQGYYVMALDARKDVQIFRYYLLEVRFRKGKTVNRWAEEVFRVYLSAKGEIEVCAKLRDTFAYSHYSDFIRYSDIDLRQRNCKWENSVYHLDPYAVCGGKKILPCLKALGFTGNIAPFGSIYTMAKMLQDSRFKMIWDKGEKYILETLNKKTLNSSWRILETILNNPDIPNKYHYIIEQFNGIENVIKIGLDSRFETLWKLEYYALIRALSRKQMNDIWPALRICFRNHYKIDDAYGYIDYINQLIRLGKDIRNAHYVCPANLQEAHFKTNRKIQQIIERERYEKERSEMEKWNVQYLERVEPYLNLDIHNKSLRLYVLPDVQAFYEEGKAMHHCVYTCGYYKHPNTLIFSCRDIEDNRVATIELDLTNHRIVQVRAACNQTPKHYKQIIKLLNKNMMQIIQIHDKAA